MYSIALLTTKIMGRISPPTAFAVGSSTSMRARCSLPGNESDTTATKQNKTKHHPSCQEIINNNTARHGTHHAHQSSVCMQLQGFGGFRERHHNTTELCQEIIKQHVVTHPSIVCMYATTRFRKAALSGAMYFKGTRETYCSYRSSCEHSCTENRQVNPC